MADGETIKAGIIKNGGEGRLLVITAEPENTEATAQPDSGMPARKPAGNVRRKKGASHAGRGQLSRKA